MPSVIRRGDFLAAALIVFTTAAAAAPIPVEVWHVGDDALSEKLAAAIEDAFRARADLFVPSSGKQPGTLIATIPTNVTETELGGRRYIFYKAGFSDPDGHPLIMTASGCLESVIADCTKQIVNDAKSTLGESSWQAHSKAK
jgi:hypothetical protein